MEKEKILVIGPGMEIGGVERSLLGLLDSFDYEKTEVDLFLYAHTGELMPYINKNVNLLPEEKLYALSKWSVSDLIKDGHFYVGFLRIITKIIGDIRARRVHCDPIGMNLCRRILTSHISPRKKHYDKAYSFFIPHYYVTEKVLAEEKIGWVHTDYTNANEKQDTAFMFSMWEKLDHIACVSEAVKTSFDSIYPELQQKTLVIENQLPVELIRIQAREFTCEKEIPEDGSFRIVSVGRFCVAKAFDDAILAAKKLHDEGLNIKWYFIGYGPDEQKLRDLVDQLGSSSYTIILGKKTNPYPYMLACDLYAQPSRYEGKAVTVCEAQLLGKPVLITRYKTSDSQLSNQSSAYICEMGVDGVVDGVKHMMGEVYEDKNDYLS